MRNRLSRLLLPFVIAVLTVICPFRVHAQYVYVNDNNPGSGSNTATGFAYIAGPALSIVTGSPFATTSTGYGAFPSPNQEVAISYGSAGGCLFVSDTLGDCVYPIGD